MSATCHRRSRTFRKRTRRVRCCSICGSTKGLQEHHLGGRNHAAHFTIPLCQQHHQRVTVLIAQAGIEMSCTSDKSERVRRARLAAYVFLWFTEEATRQ